MAGASADSLRLPIVGGGSGAAGGGAGDSPSPRHALSPLLEVRRPHCTLNCASCTALLEERFSRQSKYQTRTGRLGPAGRASEMPAIGACPEV